MIDVFAVDRDADPVDLVDADSLRAVRGAPEDLLTALESGVLEPRTPTVLTGDPDALAPSAIVADGYRRVEREFGRVHDAVSQVLTAGESWRSRRADP